MRGKSARKHLKLLGGPNDGGSAGGPCPAEPARDLGSVPRETNITVFSADGKPIIYSASEPLWLFWFGADLSWEAGLSPVNPSQAESPDGRWGIPDWAATETGLEGTAGSNRKSSVGFRCVFLPAPALLRHSFFWLGPTVRPASPRLAPPRHGLLPDRGDFPPLPSDGFCRALQIVELYLRETTQSGRGKSLFFVDASHFKRCLERCLDCVSA